MVNWNLVKDKTGYRFNNLTVVGPSEVQDKRGICKWDVKCDCGNIIQMTTDHVGKGTKRHCGCQTYSPSRIRKVDDLGPGREDATGKTFGRLIVRDGYYQLFTGGRWRSACLVECECGKVFVTGFDALSCGDTVSCGCIRSDKQKARQESLGYARPHDTDATYTLKMYKKSATRRDIPWMLTDERAKELFLGECYFCGVEPSRRVSAYKYDNDYRYNGIDRLINDIGYTEGNCVSCCWDCNNRKSNTDVDDFLAWVARVYNRLELNQCHRDEIPAHRIVR